MATKQIEHNKELLEQLVVQGRKELDAQNFPRAVALFRRAVQLAPLRYDLREYLAIALEHNISRNSPGQQEIQLETDPPPQEEPALFRTEIKESGSQKLRTAIKMPLWLMAATVIFCLCAIVTLWLFHQRQDDLYAFLARVKNLGAPAHVVQARELYQSAQEKFADADYENAITFLREAILINPESAAEYQPLLVQSYMTLGEKHLDAEQWEKSIAQFQLAADADPGLIGPWFNIGYCNYQLARQARRKNKSGETFYRDAEKSLRRALDLEPEHWESLVLLSETYPKLNQLQKACDVWYQLIELRPDSHEAKQADLNIRNFGLDPKKKPHS